MIHVNTYSIHSSLEIESTIIQVQIRWIFDETASTESLAIVHPFSPTISSICLKALMEKSCLSQELWTSCGEHLIYLGYYLWGQINRIIHYDECGIVKFKRGDKIHGLGRGSAERHSNG